MLLLGERVLTPKIELKKVWDELVRAFLDSGLPFRAVEFIEGLMLSDVCAPVIGRRDRL